MFLILVLHLFMCFHSLTPSHLVLPIFSTKSKFDTNLVDYLSSHGNVLGPMTTMNELSTFQPTHALLYEQSYKWWLLDCKIKIS